MIGQRGACYAGANDRYAFWRTCGFLLTAFEHRLQSLALSTKSGALFNCEPRRLQAAADKAGNGEGGQPRARFRLGCDIRQNVVRPHIGVERRRKTVEEYGVGLPVPRRQGAPNTHQGEGQADAPLRKIHVMEAPPRLGPLLQDRRREFGDIGPVAERRGCVFTAHQKAFDGEDMKVAVRRAIGGPKLQKCGDVEARAETKFQDAEITRRRPRFGQMAAGEEHGARFA